jgi:hypothetical protein
MNNDGKLVKFDYGKAWNRAVKEVSGSYEMTRYAKPLTEEEIKFVMWAWRSKSYNIMKGIDSAIKVTDDD